MSKIFRTKIVNDELYKRNGEEIKILSRHKNGMNITVEFNDGMVAEVFTSEIHEK